MKANLHADLLAAVGLAISTEETRYYLCGVYIEPHPLGGVLMTATDGHVLAQAYDNAGSIDKPTILSMNFKAASLKAKKNELMERRVVIEGETATIRAQISSYDDKAVDAMICEEIDGTFPNYWHVIPAHVDRRDRGTRFNFASDVLTKIAQIAERAKTGEKAILDMSQTTESDPALIRPNDNMLIVAMPTREQREAVVPSWSLRDGKLRCDEEAT